MNEKPKPPKFKVTPEEIALWLEEGKEAQRQHIAELEADPKWQEMAKRLGAFPKPKAEHGIRIIET
jgi:hypothetical protein